MYCIHCKCFNINYDIYNYNLYNMSYLLLFDPVTHRKRVTPVRTVSFRSTDATSTIQSKLDLGLHVVLTPGPIKPKAERITDEQIGAGIYNLTQPLTLGTNGQARTMAVRIWSLLGDLRYFWASEWQPWWRRKMVTWLTGARRKKTGVGWSAALRFLTIFLLIFFLYSASNIS